MSDLYDLIASSFPMGSFCLLLKYRSMMAVTKHRSVMVMGMILGMIVLLTGWVALGAWIQGHLYLIQQDSLSQHNRLEHPWDFAVAKIPGLSRLAPAPP